MCCNMENKYFLAVETKPNNYFPINLTDVKIFNGKTSTYLDELDHLTLAYTKEEIMLSIKEANLLDIDLEMPLIVLYYEKDKARKAPALTKDVSFDMWLEIKKNYHDKNYLNKIINFYNNKISKEELEKVKNTNNVEAFLYEISKLAYQDQRKLYFYLYEQRI